MIALAGVFLTGTLWYWLVEGWSWEDAAYMTVITLATDMEKYGKPRSAVYHLLILMGVVSIGYIVNRFTEAQSTFKKEFDYSNSGV